MDFYQNKNIEFYDFLNENFKISKARNWDDITKNITKAKVTATYKFFSKLFPRNLDYSDKLTTNTDSFKSIHYSTLNANKILNEVVRFSLYSDEIIVFHPLQNPAITLQNLSPIKNSQYWLKNFIDSLHFYIVLQKWVRIGIVKLIINPYDYDLEIRNKFDEQAKKRIKLLLLNDEFKNIGLKKTMDNFAEQLIPRYKDQSKDEIKQNLLEMENPRFKEEEAEEMSQKIFLKQKLRNPLIKNLKVPFGRKSMMKTSGGGNLESLLYISKLMNGNIYTTDDSNWFQLSQLESIDNWTKMAHLYSKIELPFLNDVDTSFALNLRENDKLSGVRVAFRKIYSSVSTVEASELNENMLIELNENFIEEIKKADAEWDFIKKDAKNKRAYWGAANLGSPVILNETSILPLIMGSAVWLGSNIYDEHIKSTKFKNTNPLSVFVDLKYNEPSFFSELKNCIL